MCTYFRTDRNRNYMGAALKGYAAVRQFFLKIHCVCSQPFSFRLKMWQKIEKHKTGRGMGRRQGCRVHDSRGEILQGRAKSCGKQGKGTKKTEAFAKRTENRISRPLDRAEHAAPAVAKAAGSMGLICDKKEAVLFLVRQGRLHLSGCRPC